jgi:hypothetical protein
MNTTTLVILIVIVAIVVVAIVAAAAMMGRRTRLRALPEDAKARYASSWAAIQARFIEDPRAAVREADQLAVSMLRDRGAQMEEEGKLPADLKEARGAIGANADQVDTERLRKAMLHYNKLFEDALGSSMRKMRETGQREVA